MESLEEFNWKLEYCESKGIPPAQSWAWEEAEKEYIRYINKKDK